MLGINNMGKQFTVKSMYVMSAVFLPTNGKSHNTYLQKHL